MIPPWGRVPNPDQPRRNQPVESREVLIEKARIQTMPLGTYEQGPRGWGWRPVMGLWEGVIADWQARHRGYGYTNPLSQKEIASRLAPFDSDSREFACQVCGAIYLARPSRKRLRICSNECERRYGAEQARAWRARQQQLGYRPEQNVKRTKRRQEARTGLVCAHCGTAIDAARSSRRYCSGRCRIAALRTRRRADPRTGGPAFRQPPAAFRR